jgi:hypothetical protein
VPSGRQQLSLRLPPSRHIPLAGYVGGSACEEQGMSLRVTLDLLLSVCGGTCVEAVGEDCNSPLLGTFSGCWRWMFAH